VRGDHDVNEAKLKRAAKEHFQVVSISLVDSPEVRAEWQLASAAPTKP